VRRRIVLARERGFNSKPQLHWN